MYSIIVSPHTTSWSTGTILSVLHTLRWVPRLVKKVPCKNVLSVHPRRPSMNRRLDHELSMAFVCTNVYWKLLINFARVLIKRPLLVLRESCWMFRCELMLRSNYTSLNKYKQSHKSKEPKCLVWVYPSWKMI